MLIKNAHASRWRKGCIWVAVFFFLLFNSCAKEEIILIRSEPEREYTESVQDEYILNTRSKKIHKITCGTAALIHDENRQNYEGVARVLIEEGYSFCGNCFR